MYPNGNPHIMQPCPYDGAEEVYDEYYDTAGNEHYTDVETGHHVLRNMKYHEAIELIIKLDCEAVAINRLLESEHEKRNKAEDKLSEKQVCMKMANKINMAKYKDDAINNLLSEDGET